MSSLIDRLIAEAVLRCPACGEADLRTATGELTCGTCGARWPVRNDVPDLFNRYRSDDAALQPRSSEAEAEAARLVATIVSALDLTPDADTTTRVAEIVRRASSWTTESDAITAEINDLLDRFAAERGEITVSPPAPDANRDPHVRFERHYLPDTLVSGSRVSGNVRLTNIGAHEWSSRVPGGLALRATWLDRAGRPVSSDDMTTTFAVDVSAGRSISIPIRLVAPDRAGRFTLQVRLARQDTDETFGAPLEVAVLVEPTRAGLLGRLRTRARPADEVAVEHHPLIPDYGEDHAAGVELVDTALRQRGRQHARLLEVGSGTHPHLAWLTDHEVVAIDISSPLLELGSLYFGDRFDTRLGFLCADALNPPLAPASFDLVAVFSALHHFAEPDDVLRGLARLLKPGGLVAVLCEPAGDSLEHPDTVRDLLKGINEQVFSVDEYRRIFTDAGLRIVQLRVDGTSLKAILER